MSKLRPTLELNKNQIDKLDNIEDVKEYLKKTVEKIEEFDKEVYEEQIGKVLGETTNYRIKETSDGLQIQKKDSTSGSWAVDPTALRSFNDS